MARHALVNKDNKVVNVVIWEGAEWLPPQDHYVIQDDNVDLGDIYDPEKKIFIKNAPAS